jgi:histidine ammonia-lyase
MAVIENPVTSTSILLDGETVRILDVVQVACNRQQVSLSDGAWEKVRRSRAVVEAMLLGEAPIYGLNTGVGSLKKYRLSTPEVEAFNTQVITGHAAAISADTASTDDVRAMMLVRANGIARGGSGVRAEVVQLLLEMLNRGVHPIVHPNFASVGESDLSPMAEIGQVMIGLGQAEYQGEILDGAEALRRAGLTPLRPQAKEGLAIISANAYTIGKGILLLHDLRKLLETADLAAALSFEGFAANMSILEPDVANARPFSGQSARIENLRRLLEGSYLWQTPRNLQDPLSFRCVPQIHGACDEALRFAEVALERKLNSAEDNPVVALERGILLSNGNFDSTITTLALDTLRLGFNQIASIATKRIQKLLWAEFSGLNTVLAKTQHAGEGMFLNSLGRAAVALSAEIKLLSTPASMVEVAEFNEGIEDHTTLAPLSLKRSIELLQIMQTIVALEMFVAVRAIELRGIEPGGTKRLGFGTARAADMIRSSCAGDKEGLECIKTFMRSGALLEAVKALIVQQLSA